MGLLIRLSISFWVPVFGVTVEQLCQEIEAPDRSVLRHALGGRDGQPCYPQRVSELHSRLGPAELTRCHQVMRAIVLEHARLEQISEADIEAIAWTDSHDVCLLNVGTGRGWGHFVTFAFWQGILAGLEAAWLGSTGSNATLCGRCCWTILSACSRMRPR